MTIGPWMWLAVLAVAEVNVLIWHRRLREAAAAGEVSAEAAERFVRGAAVCFAVTFAGAGIVQRAAGWDNPFCFHELPLGDPGVLAVWGVMLAVYAWVLAWVWLRGGAEVVSQVSPWLGRRVPGRRISPAAARWGITAVLILLPLATLLGRSSIDGDGAPVCRAAR